MMIDDYDINVAPEIKVKPLIRYVYIYIHQGTYFLVSYFESFLKNNIKMVEQVTIVLLQPSVASFTGG